MNKSEADAYLRATSAVEGWFFPIDAYLFAAIDEIQKRAGITGNLFEIGVHHGKTAIFLARMLREGEILGVCDVFERQELNRDRSGEGSRALFEKNMRELGGLDPSSAFGTFFPHAGRRALDARVPGVPLAPRSGERVALSERSESKGRVRGPRVFAKSSSELTTDDTTTSCRFFHIDGGHRPGDVIADLETASRAIHANGVVALDDLFNPSWPGVSEGFYRFTAAHPDAFAPILIGGNKVFFARPDAHYALDDIASFADTRAFAFDYKEWLGRRVMTAVRLSWVDLDPMGAATLHGE